MSGMIIVVVFFIVLLGIVAIEVWAPESARRGVTIGLKAASFATVISVIIAGILLYKWGINAYGRINELLGEAVKTGIKGTISDIKDSAVNTAGSAVQSMTGKLVTSIDNPRIKEVATTVQAAVKKIMT